MRTSEQTTMLQIKDTLISLDVLEKKFVCDISKCKGACCVHGDYGAPLEAEEIEIIEKHLPKINPYLTKRGKQALKEQGMRLKDDDDDFVTPLLDGEECAFTFFEAGIAKCAIEQAYINDDIDYQKPISCHLYPIRITKYPTFTAVNYHKWEICTPALDFGIKLGVPVYKFLKDPLIRKFGKDWYEELLQATESYIKQKSKDSF